MSNPPMEFKSGDQICDVCGSKCNEYLSIEIGACHYPPDICLKCVEEIGDLRMQWLESKEKSQYTKN